VNFESYSG